MSSQRQATFVLSLDCELLWGSHYIGGTDRYAYLRSGYDQFYDPLLQLCQTHSIPATWAFVGAIGLSWAEAQEILSYPVSPGYDARNQYLLSLIQKNPELWLRPDLISRVASSSAPHEIASHSLTHVPFTSPIVTPAVARHELAMSHKILCRYASQVGSFIFPENRVQYLDEFKSSPFHLYRGRDPHWFDGLFAKRMLHFVDQSLPIRPSDAIHAKDTANNSFGTGSYFLFPFDGIRSLIPAKMRVLKVIRGLHHVMQTGGVFHLWFHPWNLGSSPKMLEVCDEIFEFIACQKKAGRLSVRTMSDFWNLEKSATADPALMDTKNLNFRAHSEVPS